MLSCHVFWCILACLACNVTCRITDGRADIQDVETFSIQDLQQGQMPMPDDFREPQQQKLPWYRRFTNWFWPSQPKSQPSQQKSQPIKMENLVRQDGDCIIKYDDVMSRHHHPMILDYNKKGFLYPTNRGEQRILPISNGKTVLAACPGNRNYFKRNSRTTAYIKCNNGQLSVGREDVLWNQLGCQKKPRPTLDKGSTCGTRSRRGRTYTILWPIRRRSNIPQITLCFDEELESVIYTHHQLHGKNIDAKSVDSDRPAFKREGLFSVSANHVYSKKSQKALFFSLLDSNNHLTGLKEHYLARGHLAPDSDFVLEPEQDATYYYANAVPQWQAVNNGNWKSLENSVRELAGNHQTTLDIWTGTYGILHLPDRENNAIALYLGLTDKKTLIPVPAFLWKVIYDSTSNNAVAIVEVNDVRSRGISKSLDDLYEAPCNDLCSEIPWVDWDVDDETSGRTFCCSVSELRATIPNLPDLGSVGVLWS